jgi:ribonuclease-3
LASLFRKRTPEDKKLIALIQRIFGLKPGNLDLYKQALRHKSAAKEVESGIKDSNERLEYLGDAVLDTIVAHHLYETYRGKEEGFLTKMKSKIVSRSHLNQLALKLKIEQFVDYNKNSFMNFETLGGNAFEALVGAVFLDKGFKVTNRTIVDKILLQEVDLKDLEKTETDHKSRILVWAQKERKKVDFTVIQETDLGYKKVYQVDLVVEGEVKGTGEGTSKKKAEQEAAKNAWSAMFSD